MEISESEVSAVEQAVNEIPEKQIRELSEMQLVLVGGGIGDVIVA